MNGNWRRLSAALNGVLAINFADSPFFFIKSVRSVERRHHTLCKARTTKKVSVKVCGTSEHVGFIYVRRRCRAI